MRMVVLDGYAVNPGDLSWDYIRRFGDLVVHDRTETDNETEIVKRIGDAQIVITNKTPISANTLNSCKEIRMICVLATGYDVIDVKAANKRGIQVANVPTYGTASVGQFAIALLLEVCHGIGHHDEAVHQGRWEKHVDWCFWDTPQMELAAKTIGIIGFGRIGQTTGKIAKAMGMRVVAYDRFVNDEGKAIAEYVTMDELLAHSDVIALHCPLTSETRKIIRRENIEKMKDGVILINNARGQLVVEEDVAEALHNGKIRAAALDVVSSEPILSDNPLLKAPNCILTPHMSWASVESRQRIMECTEKNIEAFISGRPTNLVK